MMKKLYCLSIMVIIVLVNTAHAQLSLTTQFINPCGGDEHNEFIVAKTGTQSVNIADVVFGSYNPSTNSNGLGGDPVVNYNYWWRGINAVSTPYPTFSSFPDESCGQGLSCYGFRYPSIPADNADITTIINQLNTIAGCNVFLPVPSTDIIPANSNVIFFLAGGFTGSTGALCGFDNATENMNFSNHCNTGVPVATYYVVLGTAGGAGPSCTTTGGGYFSNSSRRVSILHTFNGGDTLMATNYTTSLQDYDPGAGVSTGNAGLIVPDGTGGTTWINNQGCIPPPPVVLAIRLDYFTGTITDKKAVLKWKSSYENNIRDFIIERSTNGKDFTAVTKVAPKNISGSRYIAYDGAPVTGNNFYRLRVLNLDGTVDYSQIVKLTFGKGGKANWYVYPNPATGDASVIYQSVATKNISMVVSDITGKEISNSSVRLVAGNNKIIVPSEKLSSGMYIIKIVDGSTTETAAFIRK